MKYYLIGARGRLGQALAYEYKNNNLLTLNPSVYESWSHPHMVDQISRYFDHQPHEQVTIFVASGLLDPKCSRESLFKINYHLPKNIIDGTAKLGVKIVTFGTVMEGLLQLKNTYIQSKTALGEYVSALANDGKHLTHIQIHTLFGLDQPSPFMFMGQMLAAIKNNEPFKMTSGQQLREYHHFLDAAKAIKKISESALSGVTNLSHGKPLTLREIAEAVFSSFGKENLLQISALPDPPEENYEKALFPLEIIQQVEFRDSLPAIIQYLKECYFLIENDILE